jgi:hypothetical protein
MMEDLSAAPPGAVVLLHACAHNPTGVDPTPAQWRQLLALLAARRLLPFFDSAYQGFASGDLDADAQAIRMALALGQPMLLAQSYAKNMGMYGDRVGCCCTRCPRGASAAGQHHHHHQPPQHHCLPACAPPGALPGGRPACLAPAAQASALPPRRSGSSQWSAPLRQPGPRCTGSCGCCAASCTATLLGTGQRWCAPVLASPVHALGPISPLALALASPPQNTCHCSSCASGGIEPQTQQLLAFASLALSRATLPAQVRTILCSPVLMQLWQQELAGMAQRIHSCRRALHEELRRQGVPGDWGHIAAQHGMFSYTGLSEARCRYLVQRWHVYLTLDGRLSLAGLSCARCAFLAGAIKDAVLQVPA